MTKVTELKRQIQHLTCKRDRTSDSIRESQEQIAFDIKDRDELTDQIIALQAQITELEQQPG